MPSTSFAACEQKSAKVASRMTLVNTAARTLAIPEYGSWIVTMWHIGFDSLERYAGEKFEVS